MTEIWYQTRERGDYWGKYIEPVEVEKYTEHFVWLRGRKAREGRITAYYCYFPTWADAQAHLLDIAQKRLDSARLSLQNAQGYLGNIKGLRPSDNG